MERREALPALLGFRNRAPIDEAEAARSAAAARVSEVQDAILAEAGEAAESCRAAAAETVVADSVGAAAEELVTLREKALSYRRNAAAE